MATRSYGWIYGLALSLLPTTMALGFAPHKNHELKLGEKTLRTTTIAARHYNGFAPTVDIPGAELDLDKVTGAVRLISGKLDSTLLTGDDSAAYIQFALKYIDSHPEIFGIKSSSVRLNKDATLIDSDVQFLKFKVLRGGVVIADANIDFRFKRGQLVQIVNQTFAEAPVEPAASNLDLQTIAESRSGGQVTSKGAFYRVQTLKTGYRLVRVEHFNLLKDNRSLVMEVDSKGKVFEFKEAHYYMQGRATADVYPRWYQQPLMRATLPSLQVKAGSQDVITDRDGLFNTNATPSIVDGLRGSFVSTRAVTGTPLARTGTTENGAYSIYANRVGNDAPHLDKNIAQAMVYYHTDRIVERAKNYIRADWMNATLPANVNLDDTCNAHWDGTSINLYSGDSECANTGSISDVTYHEWGHGLDSNTGGIDDGALSEGFGDIVSLVMTRSNLLGIGFLLENQAPVRDISQTHVYPRDKGEVHQEGMIIGSTFWDLFKALTVKYGEDKANDLLANYAFKMIFTARTYLDVYSALLVIDDNDGDLGNGTPNRCLLNGVFAAHGLVPADAACTLAGADEFQVKNAKGDGILRPGESATIMVKARNSANSVLSGLKGVLQIPSSVVGVSASPDNFEWDDIAAGQALPSRVSPVLHVDSQVACGASFTTQVHMTQNDREVYIPHTFQVGKNAGVAKTFVAAGLPIPIDDNSTSTVSLDISGSGWGADTLVANARIKLDIQHTYVGDLTIDLVGPDGTSKVIFRGSGAGKDLHLDQDISPLLANLKGTGGWKLNVADGADDDSGQITGFQLTLTPRNFDCR